MTLLLQLAVLCALLAYLWQCRSQMRRRSLQSWETIVARVGSGFGDLSFQEPTISGHSHQRKRTSRNLWALFVRAGVVLELADYAERNSAPAILDPVLIASLRRDAMQIRISALIGIARCALPQLAG
jgi:hypothetical protein